MTAGRTHRTLAVVAGMLALFAAVERSPEAQGEAGQLRWIRAAERGDGGIDAVEVGEWIKEQAPGLRLIDLRDASVFEAFHLPGAERVDSASLAEWVFDIGETIVIYGDENSPAAPAWAELRARSTPTQRVFHLRGGAMAWLSEVMDPMLPVDPSEEEREGFERAVELSRYFGGMPRVGVPRAEWLSRSRRGFGGDLSEVLTRMRRRGCAF